MPKGYIIARITVNDPEAYKAYVAAAGEAMRLYGARVLARGGRHEAVEGPARPRNVILEFESFEAARRYYHSPEYQEAVAIRQKVSEGELLLLEGVD